ncbi:hypothetical protein B0H19DRAFT_1075990 [Mycena capillaripes]|nr:hypothetical protein B0H19DRAFT_1075990 [Mycena capillaripes]
MSDSPTMREMPDSSVNWAGLSMGKSDWMWACRVQCNEYFWTANDKKEMGDIAPLVHAVYRTKSKIVSTLLTFFGDVFEVRDRGRVWSDKKNLPHQGGERCGLKFAIFVTLTYPGRFDIPWTACMVPRIWVPSVDYRVSARSGKGKVEVNS